ncbi:glycosyltransferase family 2 protein [Bacteroides muris (ex Afrizal et al. 2022)]|jgi:glycosyltransferase involved in cell wall biosynthesis|uniref:Glycosyltransferase family 2 protein n=1 Tax=Bacteroides muris (ex Afrizal et al. 2022) TaxID=2516960 RepID=A0A4V3RA73_9BACE|nr:glycosyltransferase family 2 protein [Bacteroides muris (ex Afrizal et al. 2022)]TGX99809.1 glycosyltransferase family 2 protein [Bacteroides muris (ex Afrizal et al. 2022)]
MKVSVIVPVYKTEKFIYRCLDSILNQSLHDIEIIVVNDCTPDNSMRIVTEYAHKDKRLHIINNPINLGPMLTRKVGYQQAIGDYILFCDSDDYLPIDALERMYVAIEQSKADIVVSAYTYIGVNGEKTKIINRISGGEASYDAYLALFDNELKHSLCAKIYSRKLFANYEYETFEKQANAEDFVLFCQLLKHVTKIQCIETSTYNYCQNLLSATQSYSDDKFLSFVNAINWQFTFFKGMNELENKSFADILNSILTLLKAGCKKNIILKIDSEILASMSFPVLRKYLPLPKIVLLYSLFEFPMFCSFYSYCGRLKKKLLLLHD